MRGQLEQISKQYPELQKSADAAKESADLSKHVLEGTDAATFRINEISLTYGDFWRIRIGNFGKVGSPKLDVTYSLIHERFPSGKQIGPVVKGSFDHAEVMPREENGSNDVLHDFRTPGFDKTSSQLVGAEETFRLEGAFVYNNGFDRIVTENFCWQTYPFPYPNPSQPDGTSNAI